MKSNQTETPINIGISGHQNNLAVQLRDIQPIKNIDNTQKTQESWAHAIINTVYQYHSHNAPSSVTVTAIQEGYRFELQGVHGKLFFELAIGQNKDGVVGIKVSRNSVHPYTDFYAAPSCDPNTKHNQNGKDLNLFALTCVRFICPAQP